MIFILFSYTGCLGSVRAQCASVSIISTPFPLCEMISHGFASALLPTNFFFLQPDCQGKRKGGGAKGEPDLGRAYLMSCGVYVLDLPSDKELPPVRRGFLLLFFGFLCHSFFRQECMQWAFRQMGDTEQPILIAVVANHTSSSKNISPGGSSSSRSSNGIWGNRGDQGIRGDSESTNGRKGIQSRSTSISMDQSPRLGSSSSSLAKIVQITASSDQRACIKY